ncbi:MAG: V-type ATP synthase subunit K [Oscillospiraceae bacterium]|nr:V-type ATP synthase subunit K [Oscillospiraceae bacterium]
MTQGIVTFWQSFGGLAIALMGASLAVAMSCLGSAKGIGIAGESAAGICAEKPALFGKTMILQMLTGIQGLFGLAVWIVAVSRLGVIGGSFAGISEQTGWLIFFACLPAAIVGWRSAIYQGRVAASAMRILVKNPGAFRESIIYCVVVVFFAAVAFKATLLMLLNINI